MQVGHETTYADIGNHHFFHYTMSVSDLPKLLRTSVKPLHRYRAVVSGGAEGALAPPELESSVNPIPTRGGRLCPPH